MQEIKPTPIILTPIHREEAITMPRRQAPARAEETPSKFNNHLEEEETLPAQEPPPQRQLETTTYQDKRTQE